MDSRERLERRARHLCSATRDLDQQLGGRRPAPKKGLHARATFPSNGCHLNDAAVRINPHHRDHAAVREEHLVERTVGVHEDLVASASDVFELR
jgi:hypothetical protein